MWLLYVIDMNSAYVFDSLFHPMLIVCWLCPSYYVLAYKFLESKDHVSSLITLSTQVTNSVPANIW